MQQDEKCELRAVPPIPKSDQLHRQDRTFVSNPFSAPSNTLLNRVSSISSSSLASLPSSLLFRSSGFPTASNVFRLLQQIIFCDMIFYTVDDGIER